MKPSAMLTSASLLSILLMTLHVTDDILRDPEAMAFGGALILLVVLILIVWLYGVLVLAERRSGYIIILVGSLLSSLTAVLHMLGAGDVTLGDIAKSSGPVFVWAVIALGVTAIFSLVLSARALWSPQKSQSRQSNNPNTEKPAARRR